MVDFLLISPRLTKNGVTEIYPKFIVGPSEDLMIRGGDFYAIWLADKNRWSTNEQDAIKLIDSELDKFAKANADTFPNGYRVLHIWDSETGMIDRWHKYCQKHLRDSFHILDENIIFSNTELTKTDYASKKLPYPLEKCDIPAYTKLMDTLYSPEERHKIEWAIGSVVSGDSKKIQKFLVLYGAAGTGKSTVLNIIQQLFEGYYSVFDAKSLGSSNNAFALEAFRSNPLVAIQHDGDLSRIEDNTRLNSLVSHELMIVNEKFKTTYSSRFNSFLFMGTNKPVKITDAKSGIIRRLIDVSPTGNRLDVKEYHQLVKQIPYELGGIAQHCLDVYESDPGIYDDYVPISMMSASNDFYNYVLDSYLIFEEEEGITLQRAWDLYRNYCEEAKVTYPMSKRVFQEELKNYFDEFHERYTVNGTRVRSYYSGFKADKFEQFQAKPKKVVKKPGIDFKHQPSLLDELLMDCPAQYANDKGTPQEKWTEVTTTLKDLDTSKLHYVKLPKNHIVIDFDIPDENGEKSLEKNLEAASKFPETYSELSKSGKGIHLHYIYTGDASKLSRVYDEHIEIKVSVGNSALRRMLTECNDIPVKTISGGLPLKGEDKVINSTTINNEAHLRTMIKKNLKKEIMPSTKSSMDFIKKLMDEAYESNIKYDVSDLRPFIFDFATRSTNQSEYCIKLISKLKFKSKDAEESNWEDSKEDALVFFDIEVFPNLLFVGWKLKGEDKPFIRWFNPSAKELEELFRYRLIGYNCRRYDNHICYGRYLGDSLAACYNRSQRIINKEEGAFIGEAYNLSYTDVYDFASAGNKKSLKKLEIEMGIHHQELDLPWDKPVPRELWEKVADYCEWDVRATEASFDYLTPDWLARQILADLAGLSVNDTTNTLTTRIIFDKDKNPQSQFLYRDLSQPVTYLEPEVLEFLKMACPEMMSVLHGPAKSLLPYFPEYEYHNGVSTYLGEVIGEGGKVYGEPGMYTDVALLDIASMHPHSAIAEVLFGVKYTTRFRDLVESRVSIKHSDWDELNHLLDGKLMTYIKWVEDNIISAKDLANALKTAINSVYGLTSASFSNPFKDKRNIDNIVAKRGALFMTDLKKAVQDKGYSVIHIKTDSIKIPNADLDIIKFVQDFGKMYGYTFEHEATYERMCLVNNAVYIARYATVDDCIDLYGQRYVLSSKDILKDCKDHPGQWTATGEQFQVPYVFKTLFSHEDILFSDMCETNSVTTAMYLDMNESLEDVSEEEKELKKILKNDPEADVKVLENKIAKGHDYRFIGRVGLFCPVKQGLNGGLLVRKKGDKYDSVGGAKDFRWLEADMLSNLTEEEKKKMVDIGYYTKLVDKAVETISKFGDFEEFISI